MLQRQRLNAVKLRHRVELQSKTEARDAVGGFSHTWATEATVYASIEPVRAADTQEAQQIEHRVTHTIWIRHRTDIQPDWRVRFGSRIFNIIGGPLAKFSERSIMQELRVVEVDPEDVT